MKEVKVSVPIRGLFNLTGEAENGVKLAHGQRVSVPIRGLFNLTRRGIPARQSIFKMGFPSPSGDYLI